MNPALLLLLLLFSFIIAFEDFKNHQIRVVWIGLFFILSQIIFIQFGSYESLLQNGLFIGLIGLVISTTLFITKRKVSQNIGLADVIFLVSLSFMMDFFWLSRILMLSLSFGYVIHVQLLQNNYVPLVGYLSAFFIVFLSLDYYLYENIYLGY